MNFIPCSHKRLFLPQRAHQQSCKVILKATMYILLPEFNVPLYPTFPAFASGTVHKPQICEPSIIIIHYLILGVFELVSSSKNFEA